MKFPKAQTCVMSRNHHRIIELYRSMTMHVSTLGCSLFSSIQMAIGTWFPLNITIIDPKFQINRTKNNFAKGQKQKTAAQCCHSAKFGGAQAKQGRALATLCFGPISFKIWI